MSEEMTEIIMEIIINAGEARNVALGAIRTARKGDIENARKAMDTTKEFLVKAHVAQTGLIQKEANGDAVEISLLMIHAQDHLMNAMTVRDLAEELVEEIAERLKNKENYL